MNYGSHSVTLPLSDNYIFLLHHRLANIAAVVDPATARPVQQCLDKLGASLVAIFNTHHHYDHVGANQQLLQSFPSSLCLWGEGGSGENTRTAGVFAGRGCSGVWRSLWVGLPSSPDTPEVILPYYFPPVTEGETGELFCGDTLFAGGCGRLFEGSPGQMVDSLSKLRALPDDTRVWCAHEYTLKNISSLL